MPTPSENAPDRVRRIRRAFEATGNGPDDVLALQTPDGREVHIASFSSNIDGARSRVEIHLAGSVEGGDPAFVIVNPPTMVPDGMGGFREDPLGALAQAIADNGGAASGIKRRRAR